MMILNRLAVALALFALLVPAPLPLAAANRKGDKFLKEGRTAEARREYDKALDLYEKALDSDPMDTAYQMAVNRVRFQASASHLQQGKALRGAGSLEEALREFQKAFAIDPSSTIAEQEIRRTIQILDQLKKDAEGGTANEEKKPQDYNLSPGQAARKAAEEHAATIRGVPDLKPLSPQITNLKIVNQSPKVMFETIGKLAGVNILMDSEYQEQQGKRYSIDLARTNLSDALDYAALLTKSFWKPLSSNTIFITNDNVTKRRDYEEHVTRVFYLQNITTPQELQEIMTTLRQVTDVRKIFPFNSQSALVVRGTADQMALAEKLMLDLDKPKPEVVVDVLVFEASRTKTSELGVGWNGGLTVPVTFTPNGPPTGTGSTTPNNSIPLSRLGSLSTNDWSIVLPGATLTALLSDSKTRVMNSPQVRATDGQKASLRLGDRYPYATGSFQPGVGSVGVSPLVSTQFQFADVGVNVDVTPRIHGTDEVSMQVELEVSTIRDRINLGGLEQPVIGQRKVSHIIRVKEGEATLIGGLMGAAERKTRSGIPGLVNIPGVGKLFGTDKVELSDNDLLVVLRPHIVRYPELTADNLKPIASGTEAIYKISYQPKDEEAPPAQPVPPQGQAGAQPALPFQPAPAKPLQPSPIQPTPQPPAQNPEAPGATAVAPPPPQEASAAAAGQPAVQLIPSSPEAQVNTSLTVRVNVENVKELFAAPMKLTFDNKVLRLVDIRRGPFMSGDGAQVTFDQTKVDSPGMAIVGLNRIAGSGGVSGSGTLVTLVFQAVGAGTTDVKFEELTLRDAKLQSITVTPPVARITVK